MVDDRLNYLTPTKKPITWGKDNAGRRKRIYDTPATPLDRLLRAGVLSPAQASELQAHRDRLNPAQIARDIHRYQDQLIGLAKDKTDRMRSALPASRPDITHGIRVS